MDERAPNQEVFLTKDEIVDRIRSEGFSEEIRGEVIKWRSWMENLVETDRDRVAMEVDMLEFYAVSGMAEEEYENAIQTYFMARSTDGCDDLVDRMLAIYPQLDSRVTEDLVIDTQREE